MPNAGTTKRKCIGCPELLGNAKKKCPSCMAIQPYKAKLKAKRTKFNEVKEEWVEKTKKHCNRTRVMDGAHLLVGKLCVLGFYPLLFYGQKVKGRNSYQAHIIIPEKVKEAFCGHAVFTTMKSLYEKLLKVYTETNENVTVSGVEQDPCAAANNLQVCENESVIDMASSQPGSSISLPVSSQQGSGISLPVSSNLGLGISLPVSSNLGLGISSSVGIMAINENHFNSGHATSRKRPQPTVRPSNSLNSAECPRIGLGASRMSDTSMSHPYRNKSGSFKLSKQELMSSIPAQDEKQHPSDNSDHVPNNKRKRNQEECTIHLNADTYSYEKIIRRRVREGKKEVLVRWKPCCGCGLVWKDIWEPSDEFVGD